MNSKNPFYIALDTSEWSQFTTIVDELAQTGCGFKVGMEAFYSLGDRTIEYVRDKDLKVFIDLKLHDIPNTTSQGILNLAKRYQPELINIHTSGGFSMMKLTKEKLLKDRINTKLLGVTVLTSLSEMDTKTIWQSSCEVEEHVLNLAKLAKEAGLDGVVCSAKEAKLIKDNISDFMIVTPGIRLNDASQDDQKRVVTPKKARELGADYLVVGRGVTKSKNLIKSFNEFMENYNYAQ